MFASMTSLRSAVNRVLFALMVLGSVAASLSAGESAEVGQLKLEGAFVEKLVLVSEDGRRHRVDPSAETLTLPRGRYRPYEVTLRGGHRCWPHQVQEVEWVAVGPGQQATLKLGVPLKQKIRLERQGTLLVVNYDLVGQDGEKYTPVRSGDKPRFVVYKGDSRVFSAELEYG